jgi:hypothetical protein
MTDERPSSGMEAKFAALSSTVTRRPDEVLATLSHVEFQILRDGELSNSKAGRDLYTGFLVSAFIGFVSLLLTIDWTVAFQQRKVWSFVLTGLLFSIIPLSICGFTIHHRRLGRTSKDSAYSALMKRLSDHFPQDSAAGAKPDAPPTPDLVIRRLP